MKYVGSRGTIFLVVSLVGGKLVIEGVGWMHKACGITAGLLLAIAATNAASALPRGNAVQAPMLADNVVKIADWRYHRSCGWTGGRWVVDLGAGRIVACRPNRPRGSWRWNREGEREGWYDSRRRAWHNDRW